MTEYYIPTGRGEAELVEKRSRFISHVWRVESEAEARARIEEVRKKHYDARHNCWCYLLREGGSIAVTAVSKDIPVEEVTAFLQEKAAATDGKTADKEVKGGVLLRACGCVEEEPKRAEELRCAKSVILVTASGRRDGKRIEKVLAFLKKQDVTVSCAFLWDADEKLIKRYYGCGILPKKRAAHSAKDVSCGQDVQEVSR